MSDPHRRRPRSNTPPASPRPAPVGPPPFQLDDVQLPDWLVPAMYAQMELAERTFPGNAAAKKVWVRRGMFDALALHDSDDAPDLLAPPGWRYPLLDLLIEAVWSLHFRPAPPNAARLAG